MKLLPVRNEEVEFGAHPLESVSSGAPRFEANPHFSVFLTSVRNSACRDA